MASDRPDRVCPSKTERPAPRRRSVPTVDLLERRELFAVTPTDYEQYMLALVNRARANPAAEGQRLLALAQTDPVLKNATKNTDLALFLQKISTYPALPPLAFNTRLIEAARAEDARMLATNRQDHAPSGFLTNPAVATGADGQVYYNVTNASWSTGENIFAFSANVNANGMTDYVDYLHAGFAIDWGNPDFGHLENLMTPGPGGALGNGLRYTEIGIGLLGNAVPTVPAAPDGPNAGLDVGPTLVAQEFGWRSTGNAILTGDVYSDKNRNGFYDPAEGLGGVTIRAVGRAGQGTFQVNTWSTGGYSLPLPTGTYDVTASGGSLTSTRTATVAIGKDNVGWDVPITPTFKADVPLSGDFDGDGKADLAVFRPDTADWSYQASSTSTTTNVNFGWPGLDVPMPGRYDGGARTEVAVYRPTTAQWFISGPTGVRTYTFGWPGLDIPEPADYDGDGKTDLAVYRPTTAQWFVYRSSDAQVKVTTFGWAGLDQPVPADYDGDGKADIAIYRPTTAQWFDYRTSDAQVKVTTFGWPGLDQPIPGKYDADGKADIAVYRPTTADWFVFRSTDQGVTQTTFGWPGLDIPKPADYDGDGKVDVAVYRPNTGEWFLNRSRDGFSTTTFGQGGTTRTVASTLAVSTAIPSPWIGWNPPSPAAQSETGSGAIGRDQARPRPRRFVPQGPDRLLAHSHRMAITS